MLRFFSALALAIQALVIAPLAAHAAAPSGPDYNAVDTYISAAMAGIPGLSLGIVHGDQVVHVRGFGVSATGGRTVTSSTPFVIGSISKSFTALGIAQLVEAGKVDFDTPVQRYLPWFRVSDPDASARITVRQLLNQTSGIPPSFPIDTPVTSVQSRVRGLATTALTAPPGTKFQYSNPNYDTLGLVIEAVSGQRYGDYVNQHIFTPLDMRQSFSSEADAEGAGLATGYQWWFGATVPADTFRADFVPAGWLSSTADDMTHYMIAQLTGGQYAGNSVASPSSISEMHRGVVANPTGGSYGMGWASVDQHGIATVFHDGDTANMHSDLILVPSTGWGVVVLSNADSVPVLVADSLDSMAKGVVNMVSGRAVDFSLSPNAAYAVFDLLILALVGFQLWSLGRGIRQGPRQTGSGTKAILRYLAWPLAWRLFVASVALAILTVFGIAIGASLGLMAATDLGVAVFVIVGLLLANAGVRIVRNARSIRTQRSSLARQTNWAPTTPAVD